MSKCAKSVTWAGGTHVFDWRAARCVDAAIAPSAVPWTVRRHAAACLRRFDEGVYSPTDIERIFEIALIGGGLGRNEAADL